MYLYTVKWFQVLLFNISNIIYNDFIYNNPSKRLNGFTWSIGDTITTTTLPGLNEPGSNRHEEVFHTYQTPRLEPHHKMHFSVIPRPLYGFKYCYLTLIILLNIIHSFASC